MKRGLVLLLLIFSFSFSSAVNYHNASEIYLNVDGEIYTLQEMFDMNLFYEDYYSNPVDFEYTNLQYEFASEIVITIDPIGEVNLLDALNAGDFIEGGYFAYNSSSERHTGNEIIFRDGRTFQEIISSREICYSNVDDECDSGYCMVPGIVLCDGVCSGAYALEDGTRCGEEGYCNSGLCGESLLVNLEHDEQQCLRGGGEIVYDNNNDKFCKFDGSSCPSGWTKYKSWTTTVNNYYGTSSSKWPCADCSTGGHTFGNSAVESCSYGTYLNAAGFIWYKYWCTKYKTGYASTTQVGCY